MKVFLLKILVGALIVWLVMGIGMQVAVALGVAPILLYNLFHFFHRK